jgi:hypothetical protein
MYLLTQELLWWMMGLSIICSKISTKGQGEVAISFERVLSKVP